MRRLLLIRKHIQRQLLSYSEVIFYIKLPDLDSILISKCSWNLAQELGIVALPTVRNLHYLTFFATNA